MHGSRRWPWVVVLALLSLWYPCRDSAAGTLSPAELRGKQIYFAGTSPAGRPIRAYVGKGLIEVPGSAMRCSACHGEDGRGNPESGVIPSDITWERLTKPYGPTTVYGRFHPPYTDATLARAISSGVDPAGNILDFSMPRYALDDDDMADLIAYVRKIEESRDPGIRDLSLKIGAVLPTGEGDGDLGHVVEALLSAYLAEMNATGGIFHRRLELKVLHSVRPTGNADDLSAQINAEGVFGLIGGFAFRDAAIVDRLAEEEEVPAVLPFGPSAGDALLLRRFPFFLMSGIAEQACVLVDFQSGRPGGSLQRFAVVADGEGLFAGAEEPVRRCAERAGWSDAGTRSTGPDTPLSAEELRTLAETKTTVLVYLGHPGALVSLLKESEQAGWRPVVLVPGTLAGGNVFELPPALDGRVFLAYPTLPKDWTAGAVAEWEMLRGRYGIGSEHMVAQASALAAAKVFVEALKRSGRLVSRARFIKALESLDEWPTGLTRPLSFDGNRRVGSTGSYVMKVDLRKGDLVAMGDWRPFR